ncbi:MAG: cupin domain-containing protein [Chloroflexi bacterium]|nr:cupin domain-containing protein [Chloroflexota bacterium]
MSQESLPAAINLREKLTLFSELWSPKIVAQMNDYYFKLVKVEGEFVWHSHPETDEVFLVMEGELRIDFRDGAVELKQGEMTVVPRGAEHRPFAQRECQILLIEPVETVNTGDAGGERTVVDPEWI